MTPQDHSKTLAIIYSLLGVITAGAATYMLVEDLSQLEHWARVLFKDARFIAASVIAICLLAAPYRLFRRRRWARILSLITTVFYVWLFPLGTILAVYTWWFMHSEEAQQFYTASNQQDL